MNNLIAFFEIPTVDFYRAIDFYETILGLKLSVSECETEKMACFIDICSASLRFIQPFPFFLSLLHLLQQRLCILFLSSSIFYPNDPDWYP